MDIEAIAKEMAQLMKAAHDDDAGNFAHFFDDAVYDDEGKGPIWTAICARAAELLPTIRAPREMVDGFRRASREFSACQSHERQQLGYGA